MAGLSWVMGLMMGKQKYDFQAASTY